MHASLRRAMGRVVVVATALVTLAVPGAASGQATGPATAVGSGGAVATVDRNATEAAIEVLRDGGNAVDAAVTAAAVLGVTDPFSAGIGGGGFMVVRRAGGQVHTIDHRETAPAAMGPTSFFESGAPLAFDDARHSGLSVGVPGTVRGWWKALRRFGTIPWTRALQPAVHVARTGFVVDGTFSDQAEANADYFDDVPATAELYLDPDGSPPDVGSVHRNPDLARTYQHIAALGPRGFYNGEIARAMVEAVRQPPVAPDADHTWRPGVMTMADVRDYDALLRPPTHVRYRGFDVYGMGPPSSGGSTVGEALNILEGYDLSSLTRRQALHLFLEASRFAFADRNAYLADPAFFDVPLDALLSDCFAARRRALIGKQAAESPVAPGDPSACGGGEPAAASAGPEEGRSTTHVTAADREGNVVSYTFTIESTGGSGIVVPGHGFLLNNELTDFNFNSVTHPNRVEGGKRPRSSMSPTIVLRDGEPFLALGSPGGSTIITTVLGILLERLDLGQSLPEAIAAPRASQRNTPATSAEPAFLQSPLAGALAARGHTFTLVPEIGAATAVEHLGQGRLLAAAEPTRRGGGSAMVVGPE